MENFTPLSSLLGGLLIGAAASLVLLTQGRIAGISGIFGAVLRSRGIGAGWQLAFLAGLLLVGALTALNPALLATAALLPAASPSVPGPSLGGLAAAGLLVGFGTRLGNGCTSGHGVCGISRMSPRSLAATLTFMGTGALTVYIVRHVLTGGA